MKLKNFNVFKAIDEYSGNVTQYLTLLSFFFFVGSVIFLIIVQPEGLAWYRGVAVAFTIMMTFTYLENKKEGEE